MPQTSQTADQMRPIQPNRFLREGVRPDVATDITTKKLSARPSRQRGGNSLSKRR